MQSVKQNSHEAAFPGWCVCVVFKGRLGTKQDSASTKLSRKTLRRSFLVPLCALFESCLRGKQGTSEKQVLALRPWTKQVMADATWSALYKGGWLSLLTSQVLGSSLRSLRHTCIAFKK